MSGDSHTRFANMSIDTVDRSNGRNGGGGHDHHFEREVEEEDVLEVEAVETYPVKNAETHRTEKYELAQQQESLVLRRSSAKFYLGIKSRKRSADFNKDDLRIVFSFGPNPSVTKGTKVVLKVDPSRHEFNALHTWDCLFFKQSGLTSMVQIQISSSAPVGKWKCEMQSYSKYTSRYKSYTLETPIYILFNPFSQGDDVFLEPKSHQDEYLLSDVGKVYTGSYKEPIGRDWAFGQFEDSVLPAAVYLLDRSTLRPSERGNPVKVARAISAMVNQVDDGGVLIGKWSGDYSDGVAPWMWTGSAKILEQYMETGSAVKYGQCWVFSAVTTTVCRALGLPCRSVTNYVSAHDTNQSLTIDRFFDKSGEELDSRDHPEIGSDSIWNFHVWNDVWMARPDLPSGFGGWQAIDATPQEASDDRYQCGPAPVEAIRRGEVGLGYDAPFVFSEVNADVCHFMEDSKSSWGFSRIKTNEYHVGKLLLTKARGDNNFGGDAEDITHLYKHKEGSNAERLAVYNAVHSSGSQRAARYYDFGKKPALEDVHIKLEEIETVKYGQPFKIRVFIENRSTQKRTLTALVKANSIYNNGVTANLICKSGGEFSWAPGKRDALILTVHPSEYMEQLVDYCLVKVYAVLRVAETHQFWSQEDDFSLVKPKLQVQQLGQLYAGRLGRLRLSFANPLEGTTALTNGYVTIECPGAFSQIRERCDVVYRNFSHDILVTPRKSGKFTVVATFTSNEMFDVHGSLKIEIQ